jgi:hypothetical protein
MNTANLKLEGLCLALAAINNLLVRKGLVAREELAAVLDSALETAEMDRGTLSPANLHAIQFPIRVLSLANQATEEAPLRFSELARTIGELKDSASDPAR